MFTIIEIRQRINPAHEARIGGYIHLIPISHQVAIDIGTRHHDRHLHIVFAIQDASGDAVIGWPGEVGDSSLECVRLVLWFLAARHHALPLRPMAFSGSGTTLPRSRSSS